MTKKKIVALTGSGISAESGIATFRGPEGLWEGHRVQDVATPEAFERDPELVLRFYNERRAKLNTVEPNAAHYALRRLEEKFEVCVITQNVDNLHERAGSSHIIHLHGELMKSRGVGEENAFYECSEDISLGDLCPRGSQLRPHIVWFGEAVPMIVPAMEETAIADILIIVGTSMLVYPAAGLIDYADRATEIYVINPNPPAVRSHIGLKVIAKSATEGLQELVERLLAQA